MQRCLRAIVLAFAASTAATLARAEENASLQPYQMVRSLQLVQDRIADGDHAALPMQKKLLELIDARFRMAKPEDFVDKRNFRSMLIYAMSGGNPVTLEVVKSRLKLEKSDAVLAEGLLAYLNGRPNVARDALKATDPMAQTADLGAFLALVKGTLAPTDAPADAIAMFDEARLLGPGTLVEEAALRRSIMLIGKLGDAKRFTEWSSQYVRRFLRSPYASQFADAFVTGVVTLHASIDFHAVEEVIAGMASEQRNVIYLRLARRAAIEGLSDVAGFAAAHVEKDEPEEIAKDDPRAILYASLSDVRSGNIEDVLAKLKTIDRASLSERDRQLLDAVESVATQVTAPGSALQPAEAETAPPPPKAAEATEVTEIAKAEAVALAEGPLPDVVPEAEPAAPDDKHPAAPPAKPAEAAEDHSIPVAEASPEAKASKLAPSAGPVHAPDAGEAEVTAEAGEEKPDEAAAAANLVVVDARQKLDAIDKLLEENAKK